MKPKLKEIKILMMENDVKLIHMSREIGVTSSYLSNIFNGRLPLVLEMAKRMKPFLKARLPNDAYLKAIEIMNCYLSLEA